MPEFEDDVVDGEGGSFDNLDFNVEDEYKPNPLIPKGTYHGVVTSVKPNFVQYCLVWDICLHDNGGMMNDGSTPIDGAHVEFRNWLPKPGDESIMTTSGKNTKRQSKINSLKDFEEAVGINMSTPQIITTALSEAQWVGIEVSVEVGIREWQGRFLNDVNKMKKSQVF
jgi:hypothetical protein